MVFASIESASETSNVPIDDFFEIPNLQGHCPSGDAIVQVQKHHDGVSRIVGYCFSNVALLIRCYPGPVHSFVKSNRIWLSET